MRHRTPRAPERYACRACDGRPRVVTTPERGRAFGQRCVVCAGDGYVLTPMGGNPFWAAAAE